MTTLRAACYERVSTEEQALRGFSIAAQIDNLSEYCKKNGMKLIRHYTDEGISGAKPPLKRPALQQLLEDVQAGKIDIILFTKLDRWFRSVKEYFKVQEILDCCKVEWKAIHEDYDTSTANGRMAITIFLAIAQNERDRTSERVKAVFAHKRKNKDASVFGGPHKSFGYMKQKDADGVYRLVKDPEDKHMCEAFWKHLMEHDNFSMVARDMYNVYGIKKTPNAWRFIAKNSIYCGVYEGVEDYCEPYVSKEDWKKVQECIDARKHDPTPKRIYLFSGMMHCPVCGSALMATSTSNAYKGKKYPSLSYRCRHRTTFCNFKRTLTEPTLEKMLFAKLPELIQQEIDSFELEMKAQNSKPKHNITRLRERLRTLNASYMAGNIPDEDYIKEGNELKALIAQAEQEAPQVERDLTPLRKLLDDDFHSIYSSLSKEEKREFWRNILQEIKIEDNKIVDIVFKY